MSAVTWGTFNAAQSKTLPKSFEPAPETAISAGDFLFSRANTLELVGAVVMVRQNHPNLFLSDKILRLDLDDKLKPWLLKYLQGHEGRRKLAEISTGNQASMRNIGQSGLKAVSIPLPPLNEQRRIVEKIEAMFERIDKGVENLRAARSTLALYRQSLLKSAFEGRLTADWRAKNPSALEDPKNLLARIGKERDTRYKAALADWQTALTHWRDAGETGKKPAKPKRLPELDPPTGIELARLPVIPDCWAVTTVNDLACHITSGSRDWKPFYDRGSSTFIMAQNIRSGFYDGSFQQRIDPPLQSMSATRTRVERNDLLATIVGANTGNFCIFPKATDDHFVCQSVALIRLLNPQQADYLNKYFQDDYSGKKILDYYIYGAGRPHLSFEDLKRTLVPICSPAEQTEITRILDARLDAADKMEAEIDAALARAEALRQSILKRAFAGDLVPHDPTDEPASTLLARIKAERAAALRNKTAKAKSTKPAKRKTKA